MKLIFKLATSVVFSFFILFNIYMGISYANPADYTVCPDDLGGGVDGLRCTGGGGPTYESYRCSNELFCSIKRKIEDYSCSGDLAYCVEGSNNCIKCLHREAPDGTYGQDTTACIPIVENGEVQVEYRCWKGDSCPSNWAQASERNCLFQSNAIEPKTCCRYTPPSSASGTNTNTVRCSVEHGAGTYQCTTASECQSPNTFYSPTERTLCVSSYGAGYGCCKTSSSVDTTPSCPVSDGVHYCANDKQNGYPDDYINANYECKDSSGNPTGQSCYHENPTRSNTGPAAPGSSDGSGGAAEDPNSCESTLGNDGSTYQCQAGPRCVGGSVYDGPFHKCADTSKPTCCKIPPSGGGGTTSTNLPTAPKVLGYERWCNETGQISYKFNFTPGTGTGVTHKLIYIGALPLGDMSAPYTTSPNTYTINNYVSGTFIPAAGGNGFTPHTRVNYDIQACNSAGCTVDPMRWWSIEDTGDACTPSSTGGTPTGPCSEHGGIKSGTNFTDVCDRKVFNPDNAQKTIAQGNPYYGKTYEKRYRCSEGVDIFDYDSPDSTRCSAKPWFDPPAGTDTPPTTGSSELCDPNNPVEGCLCTGGRCTATYQPIFSNWGCFTSTWDNNSLGRCCPNDSRYACSLGECAANAAACTTTSGGSGTSTRITCYEDRDGDGYGNKNDFTTTVATACPSGRVTDNTDCYDGNPAAHPGQADIYQADRGDGSFDYNCANGNEKTYITSTLTGPIGKCQSTMPTGQVGFSSDMACGNSGEFNLCFRWNGSECGSYENVVESSDSHKQSCPPAVAGTTSSWAVIPGGNVTQYCQ